MYVPNAPFHKIEVDRKSSHEPDCQRQQHAQQKNGVGKVGVHHARRIDLGQNLKAFHDRNAQTLSNQYGFESSFEGKTCFQQGAHPQDKTEEEAQGNGEPDAGNVAPAKGGRNDHPQYFTDAAAYQAMPGSLKSKADMVFGRLGNSGLGCSMVVVRMIFHDRKV